MAITYINSSGNQANGGNLILTPPTTQTGDIMICAVTQHDQAIAVTFPAGWTKFQEGDNPNGLMRATLAWKRCVGAEGAFTITNTGTDTIVGVVIVYRGCIATESPIHASSLRHNASSDTCTADTISTTVANCMIVFTMHDSDNGTSSAQTCTDPGALTERIDQATTLGTDAAVSGADAIKASTGSTGNATGTLSLGPDVNSGGLTALKPAPVTKTKTYTLAARLFKAETKAYTLAVRLVNRLTATYSLAARLFKTQFKTYTISTRLSKTQAKTYTLAGRLVSRLTATYTLAGGLVKRLSVTYSLAGRLVRRLPKTYTLGVRLFKTRVKTYTLAAKLVSQLAKTYTLAVRIVSRLTKTYTLAARLVSRSTRTYTLAARLTQRLTRTYTLGARLVTQLTKTFTLAAKLIVRLTKTYTLSARLQKRPTKTYTIGTRLWKTQTKTYAIGTYLISEYFWELEKRVETLEAEIAELKRPKAQFVI